MPHSARSPPPSKRHSRPTVEGAVAIGNDSQGFMAKPCTPHPITRKGYATSVRQQSCQRLCNAQRVQFFKIKTANVRGQGARPLAFSWGFKGAILSRERMAPFAAPLRVRREKHAALPRCITRSGTLPQPPHPRSDTAARPWRKTSHSPRRIRRSSADATLSRLRFRHSPASRSS